MNYMIYGKHKDDKSYGAMDLSTGSVGVGLMYATLVPNFERAKHYVDTLAAQIKDFSFQVVVSRIFRKMVCRVWQE